MCLACVVIICFITTQAEICKYLAFFGKSLQDFAFFVKIGEILKLAIAKRISCVNFIYNPNNYLVSEADSHL